MKIYIEQPIIPDTMNHSYEEMMRSLPFDEKVLWSMDKDNEDVFQGWLKDFDDLGYRVVDALDLVTTYGLYELTHWYKETTLEELLKTVPAAHHSVQLSNALS